MRDVLIEDFFGKFALTDQRTGNFLDVDDKFTAKRNEVFAVKTFASKKEAKHFAEKRHWIVFS